jgi:glycosyltransferase involved in cell wall biosynthesis
MLPEQPKISVIVPVYNVWRYLGHCLKTLGNQTIAVPYEIVAVNDGSTDQSRQILGLLADQFPQIRIIDQENAGVSAARMTGLRAARGEFVCFVDSDDYVSENYLERLYRACTVNQADIACCSYYCHAVGSDLLFEYPFRRAGVFDTTIAMKKLLHDVFIQSYLWGKLFKKDLFTKANVVFPKMCFEDLAVLSRIFAQAKRVALLDESLYFYNVRPDSTLGSITPKKMNDYMRAVVMVRRGLEENGIYPTYRNSFRFLAAKTWTCCLYYLVKMHLNLRDPRGYIYHLYRVTRALNLFGKDAFNATKMLEEGLQPVVDQPEPFWWMRSARRHGLPLPENK